MNIIITYDPRWEYKPENVTPCWASLDTVDYIAGLMENLGYSALLVQADDRFEYTLREIKNSHPGSLVFWLNEFMPTNSVVDRFTASIIEKVGIMQTGPHSAVLGVGLDKEATKNVFRKLGLSTPKSVVVYPGDDSSIYRSIHWDGFAIIKPLLQGGSNGIDQFSVLYAQDTDSIRAKVEQIHLRFNEPAIIEKYIGGNDSREFSVPILIFNTGRIAELPIIEIDLGQVSETHIKYKFLTQAFKHEKRVSSKTFDEKSYLKIPADLPTETMRRIYSDVGKIAQEIGCIDMIRTDVRHDSTGLYYIEVNANPGKNKFSYLMMSAYSIGLDYSEIIAFIPYQALLRYGIKPSKKLERLVKPVKELIKTHKAHEMRG
jgi:D-alanine-D-alanine ligase-like ATP-grasp enzyme